MGGCKRNPFVYGEIDFEKPYSCSQCGKANLSIKIDAIHFRAMKADWKREEMLKGLTDVQYVASILLLQ